MSSTDDKKDSNRPETDSQENSHDDQSGESVEGDQPKTASLGGDLTDGVEQESHSVDAGSQEGVMKESHPIEGPSQDPQYIESSTASLGGDLTDGVEQESHSVDAGSQEAVMEKSHPIEGLPQDPKVTLADNPPMSSDDWARLMLSEVNKSTSLADFRANLERVMTKFREENTEVVLQQSMEALHQENTRLALENEVLKQLNSKVELQDELGKEQTDLLEKLALYTVQNRLNASDPADLTTQEVELLKEKARQCEEMLKNMEAAKSQLEMRVQQMKHDSGTHNKETGTSGGGEDSEKQDQDQNTDKD